MATLARPRPSVDRPHDLQSTIPTPFPTQHLRRLQDDLLDDLAAEPVDYDDTTVPPNDIQTSVAAVQHSCLISLTNILSLSSPLDPSPHPSDAQHPNSAAIPLHQALAEPPLYSLVHALRARDGYADRCDPSLDEAVLLSQLHELVDATAPSLNRTDAHLAQALVALLLDLQQLPASLASAQPVPSSDHPQDTQDAASMSPYATIASLQRQLSFLQPSSSGSKPTPAESVRTALLWARIDQQLDTIVSLCKARASSSGASLTQPSEFRNGTKGSRPLSDDTLPPDYDFEYHHNPNERPPSYVADGQLSAFSEKMDDSCVAEEYPPEKISPHASTSLCSADTAVTAQRNYPVSPGPIDLDTITHAIERLYVAAPQLANQRVELRTEKIVQMEKAKKGGKGKVRILADSPDPELDKMLELLGRASLREIPDQSAVIDVHRTGREADIEEQRGKYLEHLVRRSYAGRLHSQDAVPSLGRSYSSDAAAGLQDTTEEEALDVQLEENSSWNGKRASYPAAPKSGPTLEPPAERLRSRSVSAPHLAWLRPKDKSGNATGVKEGFASLTRTLSSDAKALSSLGRTKSVRSQISGRLRGASKSRPPSAGGEGVNYGALDLVYVAEHHETLKHVLLFIASASSLGPAPSVVPLAEVLPSNSTGTYGDCLFLRLAGTPSPPLALPVPVVPGSKTVLNRGGHWEVKASCYQTGLPPKESEDLSLLPASELVSLSPSSYACCSCSLPLVPAPPTRYRDLPSEHWEELIDAWMCHPEGQTLAISGVHSSDGTGRERLWVWPKCDEALVGGSYVLFDAEAVAGGNIKCMGGQEANVVLPPTYAFSPLEALVGFEVVRRGYGRYNVSKSDFTSLKQPSLLRTVCWGLHKRRGGNTRLARCLCGAILGRQHDRKLEDGSVLRIYRLFKYAIRPISATSQVPRIPMSAFVLHDMLEHVRAHATYRFVLSDEEDEKPRLLIWLFKPRIRISYMLSAPALLPKSGTVDASKVLYKILGPTSAASDFKETLSKYPGFPQAEYLFYPMDVCRKLAGLLKESTGSYPESMRTMTGLDVGWLTMA